MKINGVDHVSINVNDFEKLKEFYAQLLGFQELQTVDCGEFDITYFALPNGLRLEMFNYHGKNFATSHEESEPGLRHLAFNVTDVAEHEKILTSEGVDIILPTCDLPDLGVRVLLFLDPDGTTLEFCESLTETNFEEQAITGGNDK